MRGQRRQRRDVGLGAGRNRTCSPCSSTPMRREYGPLRPRISPHRRLRPACRLQLRGAGRPLGLDRLALPAALRQPGPVRAHPRPGRPGHWSIRPSEAFTTERRYLPGTLLVETTFTTDTGVARLTDAIAFADGQRRHELGPDSPHELVRGVECTAGEVELLFDLAPRPEYGLVRPLFRETEEGGRTFGAPSQVAITASVPVDIADSTMSAVFTLSEGDRAASRCAGRRSRRRRCSRPRPAWSKRESKTRPRRGVPGREITTSTRAATGTWCASARVCCTASPTARPARSLPPHDVAARVRRRRAQLGLPLRVDQGCQPHARGARHRTAGRGREVRPS